MTEELVSVIVPVYNVEKYLDKCVESILRQTYTNTEIILVDDGSRDSCGQRCDEWAEKDGRIQVIHKKNAGLGLARNSGLEVASGKYAVFVDSDDFLETDMIEKLVNRAAQTGADTVYCSLSRCYSDSTKENIVQKYTDEVFCGDDIVDKVLLELIGTAPEEAEDRQLYMSVWHGIYSMELIRRYNIVFPSERVFISEDAIFHIDYLRRAGRVAFIPDCLYCYRENEKSLSMRYNPERVVKVKELYHEINRRLGEFLPEEKYVLRNQRMFLGGIRSCVCSVVRACPADRLKKIRSICGDETLRRVLKVYPWQKNPLKQRIFNLMLKCRCAVVLFVLAELANER